MAIWSEGLAREDGRERRAKSFQQLSPGRDAGGEGLQGVSKGVGQRPLGFPHSSLWDWEEVERIMWPVGLAEVLLPGCPALLTLRGV